MPIYKLFHAMERDVRFHCNPEQWKLHREAYELVATVTAKHPEEVYAFTQNDLCGGNWCVPDGNVIPINKSGRSTSVGDVVVDTVTGESFMCASVGWMRLRKE